MILAKSKKKISSEGGGPRLSDFFTKILSLKNLFSGGGGERRGVGGGGC